MTGDKSRVYGRDPDTKYQPVKENLIVFKFKDGRSGQEDILLKIIRVVHHEFVLQGRVSELISTLTT